MGAVSTLETTVFVPGLSELQIYGNISDPGMRHYPPRVALALRTPGWGFHTVRSGVDSGDRRFRPRFVRVVYTCIEIFFMRVWDHILPGWCWLAPALMASRKSQQPLAWIWTLGSANRMPILFEI